MPTLAYNVELYSGGVWTAVNDNAVLDVQTSHSQAISDDGGTFGADSEATATVQVLTTSHGLASQEQPIRISYSIDGGGYDYVFWGVVSNRRRSLTNAEWQCEGPKRRIAKTRAYSPAFYRRPIATKTSASSIDNPGDANYAGGLINYALWFADGRPYEQAGTYPNAAFYYSLDQAIIAPDWSWLAGDDAWAECLNLATACGGQLFQSESGIVIYRQPLAFGAGSATYTFDEGVYTDLDEEDASTYAATLQCSYIPRAARPMQEVVNDDTPRLIAPNETILFAVEPEQPLKSLYLTQWNLLPAEAFQMTRLDGEPVAYESGSGFNHVVAYAAQRVELAVANHTSGPIILNRLILRGEPITSGEPASITVGSGAKPILTLPDNPNIQSESAAKKIANMSLAFYSVQRPQRTISGCPIDLARYVGEAVNLSNSTMGISGKHIITGIDGDDTGGKVRYTLVPTANLPIDNQYYKASSTYAYGSVRALVW